MSSKPGVSSASSSLNRIPKHVHELLSTLNDDEFLRILDAIVEGHPYVAAKTIEASIKNVYKKLEDSGMDAQTLKRVKNNTNEIMKQMRAESRKDLGHDSLVENSDRKRKQI